MPLRNLAFIVLAAALSLACFVTASRNRYAASVAEAMDTIRSQYIEHVTYRSLYENAMNGMVEKLDPYSSYIPPTDYRHFKEGLDQEFGGIGIVVEIDPDSRRLVVLSPLVGTPAARAGIRAGDTILAIEGQDTMGMSMRESLDLIRGEVGQTVRLTIQHPGQEEPLDLVIARAEIPIDSVLGDRRREDGSWDFELAADRRIGYLRIVAFGEKTGAEVQRVIERLQPQAMVLDLRDNAGGLLSAAVETSDLFLTQGTIVSIRGRDAVELETFEAEPSASLHGSVPVAILVNRFTASAAEIVAACLQDHGRATIIGQRTWGKGTVQKLIELEAREAALKLTTASYWRPSGRNIHREPGAGEDQDWGVRPTEGCEVILSDAEAEQVRLARRQRDAFTNGRAEEKQQAENPGGEPVVDRQLREAVRCLQEALARGHPVRRAA